MKNSVSQVINKKKSWKFLGLEDSEPNDIYWTHWKAVRNYFL